MVHRYLLTLTLALSLTPAITHAMTPCADRITTVRVIQAAVKKGVALTPEQSTYLQNWHQDCNTPESHAALIREGAGIPNSLGPNPETVQSRSFRQTLAEALYRTSENMGNSRSVYCSSRVWGRGASAKVVTSCY